MTMRSVTPTAYCPDGSSKCRLPSAAVLNCRTILAVTPCDAAVKNFLIDQELIYGEIFKGITGYSFRKLVTVLDFDSYKNSVESVFRTFSGLRPRR